MSKIDLPFPFTRLNLGCFYQMFGQGWLNMDLLELAAVAQEKKVHFAKWDVRQALPIPDASCDVIYSSHMFEHLNPFYELLPLLKQCHRILKPSGVIRIVVPDLAMLIQGYVNKDWSWLAPDAQPEKFRSLKSAALKFSMLAFGGDDPSYNRHNWGGHMGLYDQEGFAELLALAGFDPAQISASIVGQSANSHLKDDYVSGKVYDMWPDHSMAIEAVR